MTSRGTRWMNTDGGASDAFWCATRTTLSAASGSARKRTESSVTVVRSNVVMSGSLRRANDDNGLASTDRLSFAARDLEDGPRDGRLYRHLHLHGLDDD